MTDRVVRILIESFPKILIPGLVTTIPLTVISFSLAMIIAVVVALVQLFVVFTDCPAWVS